LFVAGAAAAITKEGLVAEPIFFKLQFPAMLIILLCFRIGIFAAKDGKLSRPFGAFLVTVYVIYGVLNAIFGKTQESDVEVSQLSQSSAAQATEYFEPVDISFPLSR
jgi:hypothetical protein